MNKQEIAKSFEDPNAGTNRIAIALGVKPERLAPLMMLIGEIAHGMPANEAFFVAEIMRRVWAKLDNDPEKQYAMFVIGGWMEKTLAKKVQNKNIIVD